MNALETRNVTKRFGQVTAVNDVSLSIEPGEIVAILGPNGAGKTTLIDMCLGLQKTSAGTTKLYGMPPRHAIQRSLVGVVQQTGSLDQDSTPRQVLRLLSAMHVSTLPVEEILERTDLTALANTRIRKLSGGEQQRVRLALALISDPMLLILDEPTTGMDPLNRRAFWEIMSAECARGRTVIFATHYLAEAQDFAQRTIIMRGGHVIADAPTPHIQELAGGTTVTASVTRTHNLEAAIGDLGITGCQWQEGSNGEATFTTVTRKSDDLAKLLFEHGAHDLRIEGRSLDEAYITLIESDSSFEEIVAGQTHVSHVEDSADKARQEGQQR